MIENLDYILIYISLMLVLFFYGSWGIKKFLRNVEESNIVKFVLFIILVLGLGSLILGKVVNYIINLGDSLKWVVFLILIGICYREFKEFMK